jgi:hypothetical protein
MNLHSLIYSPHKLQTYLSDPTVDPLANNGELLTMARQSDVEAGRQSFIILMQDKRVASVSISINSTIQIQALAMQYTRMATTAYLYPVTYVEDPLALIHGGFFPTSFDVNESYFVDYVMTGDVHLAQFWSGKFGIQKKLMALHKEPVWVYHTLNKYIQDGIKEAISLPLLLFTPQLVYRESNRPRTDMALFLPLHQSTNEAVDKYIPVTRYAAGMSAGLYNKPTTEQFCGTFYYSEPESATGLMYQKSRTFLNKYEAVKALDTKGQYRHLLYKLSTNIVFMAFIKDELPEGLMMTPEQFMKLNYQFGLGWPSSTTNLKQTPHYMGSQLGLYTLEDILDQPLCLLGKQHGLHIIKLRRMVGFYNLVEEVLDCRDRAVSFASLISLNICL